MFSPDGKVCVLQRGNSIQIWSIEQRKLKERLQTYEGTTAIPGVALSNDAKLIPQERFGFAVHSAFFSPSGSFLALQSTVSKGRAWIRVYKYDELLAEKNIGFRPCFFGFLDEETIWYRLTLQDESPVIEWKWQSQNDEKTLFEKTGLGDFFLQNMACSYELCFSEIYHPNQGTGVVAHNRKSELVVSFDLKSILGLHGLYIALSFGSNLSVYDLDEVLQGRKEPVFTKKGVWKVSRDFSAALSSEKNIRLVDLVESKRLVDLYLVFWSFLPPYVILLVSDWLCCICNKNSIEATERWQHSKKVEVLLGVQKSVAAVREKRGAQK